jgi:hypothetical protein
MKKLVAVLMVGVALSGCGEGATQVREEILKVRATPYRFTSVKKLEIVPMVDEVKVDGIVLNRGSCELIEPIDIHEKQGRFGVSLRYGQSEAYYTSCQEVYEVKIRTSQGEISFTTR